MTDNLDQVLGHGANALVVGGSEALANEVRKRYTHVIAADPSRTLGAAPSIRLLKDGEVTFVSGNPDETVRIPDENECVVLAFTLANADDRTAVVQPWCRRLRPGGRLVALEWTAFPKHEPDSPAALHAELLALLAENARYRKVTSKEMVHSLQVSGLAHVRQQTLDADLLFNESDLAYMAAEGISILHELGLPENSLVARLREGPLQPVPLTVAYGIHKAEVSIEEARAEVEAEEKNAASSGLPTLPADRGLKELLVRLLADLTSDPEDAARRLLMTFGARALATVHDPRQIADASGLSRDAAAKLALILDIGRHLHQPFASGVTEVHGPEDAYRHLGPQMASLTREHFRGLYLNVKGTIVADEVVSIGTLTTALVHPREVFAPAIERHCHSILIAHNHPSGDPNPSQEDIHITRELAEAGRLLGIELLDHIVIGRDSYVSIKERGHF